MGAEAKSRALLVAYLSVALLVAGCVGPAENGLNESAGVPSDGADSTEGSPSADSTAGGAQAPVGARVDARAVLDGSEARLAGFVAFTLLDAGLQSLYSDIYAGLPANVQAELPADRTWALGLFLEESFITDLEDPRAVVSEHAAVIALPDFTERKDRIHYVDVQGQVFDLLQYANEEQESVPRLPLIVGETYNLLEPRTFDLATMYQDFDTVTGGNIATHAGAPGFAFGTTLQHMEAAAAESSGETPHEHLFDIGLYDLFDARYLPPSTSAETFRVPVVTLHRNKGQELLGDRVHIEGFLISETKLKQDAQARVPELRDLAEAWTDVKAASRAFVNQGMSELDNPALSRLAEESQSRAANQHRIPGYFLAYEIAPEDPRGFFALQDLAEDPFPEEELLAHIESQGYATGTTAETVCKATSQGTCEFPYDVGVYHLLNFTIGNDYLPTLYQVPVVFPAKTIPLALRTATLTPVRFEGVWVQESLLRDDIHAAVARNMDNAAFAEVFLNYDPSSRPWADRLKTVDGFLYAFELEVVPPLHDAPAPVLLYKEGEGDEVTLQWTPTIAGDFDRYEVHQSATPRFRPEESTLVETVTDIDQTSYVPGNLDARGRYFKVWVFDDTNVFTSSNGLRVGDLTAEAFGGDGEPTVTLEGVTRCADELDSCLRVTWTADPTDTFEKFEIHRTTADGPSSVVATFTDDRRRSHQDEGLSCGTEYRYQVKLYASGQVLTSDELAATPSLVGGGCPSAEQATITLQSVTRCPGKPESCLDLTWTATVTSEFERFEIHRAIGGAQLAVLGTLTDSTTRAYRDEGLICGTEYRYQVKLYASGQVATSTERAETPSPAGACPSNDPPSATIESVTRCVDAPQSCLRVTWTSDGMDQFQKFEVYRRTSGSSWALVDTIIDSSVRTFRDDGLACGTEYWYQVKIHAGGQVATSNELSETPRRPSGYCY